MSVQHYLWTDKMGVEHKVPEGACTICTHCTDLFMDPCHGNRIYAAVCELYDDTTEHSRSCDQYERDDTMKLRRLEENGTQES